jgi:hypothetical protein
MGVDQPQAVRPENPNPRSPRDLNHRPLKLLAVLPNLPEPRRDDRDHFGAGINRILNRLLHELGRSPKGITYKARRLVESASAELQPGEGRQLANLFYSTPEGGKSYRVDACRLDNTHAYLVEDDGRMALAGVKRCDAIAGLCVDAQAFHLSENTLIAAGAAGLARRLGLHYLVVPDPRNVVAAQFNVLDPATRRAAPAWLDGHHGDRDAGVRRRVRGHPPLQDGGPARGVVLAEIGRGFLASSLPLS